MPAEEAEIVDDEFKELESTAKIWKAISIFAIISAIALGATTGYLNSRLHVAEENNFQVTEWQTAYAELVEQVGKDGVYKGQYILRQTISGWDDLTPTEANVIFADWRGGEELRGALIAKYLRNDGDSEAERVANARAEIEAGWE